MDYYIAYGNESPWWEYAANAQPIEFPCLPHMQFFTHIADGVTSVYEVESGMRLYRHTGLGNIAAAVTDAIARIGVDKVAQVANAAKVRMSAIPKPPPPTPADRIQWEEVKRTNYSSDQFSEVVRWARQRGMKEFIVAYAGIRVIVQHIGTTLISVTPKASKDGGLFVMPPESDNRDECRGEKYWQTVYGGRKLHEACYTVMRAWAMNPTREGVYAIVGGESDHCACCGMGLTDPLSRSRGIGPECWQKIYADPSAVRAKRNKKEIPR